MKLEIQKSNTDNTVYKLTITELDMARVKFDKIDRKILDECSSEDPANKATVADRLLALELTARRIEESYNKQSW